MILPQNAFQKFEFVSAYGFQHEFAITGVVKKRPTFAARA
jgi:hypothetical protein